MDVREPVIPRVRVDKARHESTHKEHDYYQRRHGPVKRNQNRSETIFPGNSGDTILIYHSFSSFLFGEVPGTPYLIVVPNQQTTLPHHPRKYAVNGISKSLPVLRAKGLRASRIHTVVTEALHEVPHGEALSDICLCIDLASGVDGRCAFFHYTGGQWDVGGDYKVRVRNIIKDIHIGDIRAFGYLNGCDKF